MTYDVPINSRGAIALDPAACTSCMLCVRECPDWCITLEAHMEDDPDAVGRPAGGAAAGGGRGRRTKLVLDRFEIDYGLCMFCGICVEVCPFDALTWTAQYDVSTAAADGLIYGIDALAALWPTDRGHAGYDAPSKD